MPDTSPPPPPPAVGFGIDPWVMSFLILAGAVVLYVLLRSIVLRKLARMAAATDNDLDDRLVDFARGFSGIAVFFVAFLLILRAHGIAITPLLAGAGIAGVAIGFAAKETLADILAGIFLIVDRPMRRGDRVKIERIGHEWGAWGDVVDIGLRRTKVKNTDGVVVNYPNNLLANSVITNFSHEPGPVRVRVRLPVDYDADVDRAMEVVEAAIGRTGPVVEGSSQVVVRAVWDTRAGHLLAGVLLEGRYRIEDVRDRTRIRSTVLRNILADLKSAGIRLAAPRFRLDDGGREEA